MKPFDFPEGATPLHDYSGLISKTILTQHDLNREEAENIHIAQKKYLTRKVPAPATWFNIPSLKIIHKTMLNHVWIWAGEFRKSVTSIGIQPYRIPFELGELCADVQAWQQEGITLSKLEQAARIHHRLVFIHPFENGNGRFSRLVADRYLIACGCKHPHWPYLEDTGDIRSVYIQTLKAADQGDYEPLINLMRQFGASEKKEITKS